MTIEKGETLFSDDSAAVRKIAVKLHRRDIAKRIIVLEILMKIVGFAANNEQIAAFSALISRRIADHQTGFVVRDKRTGAD